MKFFGELQMSQSRRAHFSRHFQGIIAGGDRHDSVKIALIACHFVLQGSVIAIVLCGDPCRFLAVSVVSLIEMMQVAHPRTAMTDNHQVSLPLHNVRLFTVQPSPLPRCCRSWASSSPPLVTCTAHTLKNHCLNNLCSTDRPSSDIVARWL